MDTSGLMTSQRKDWRTPTWIAESVDRVLDGITLDPCGSSRNTQVVQATLVIRPPADGLTEEWPVGTVFMNPPYGREIGKWAKKYQGAWRCRSTVSGIALVPARTDTRWWRTLMMDTALIAFIHGRVQFDDRLEGAATFPSALVLHTMDSEVECRFIREFRRVSSIYVPLKRRVLCEAK